MYFCFISFLFCLNVSFSFNTLYIIEAAEKKILSGEKRAESIKRQALGELQDNTFIKKIDYFDIRDAASLKEVKNLTKTKDIIVAAAAIIGQTRLIDNVVINKKK